MTKIEEIATVKSNRTFGSQLKKFSLLIANC
jgi:hypothetical protein